MNKGAIVGGRAQLTSVCQAAQGAALRPLMLLAVGAAALFALHGSPLGERMRDWQMLAECLQTGDFEARVYFFALSSPLAMLGTPRRIFFGLAGFAFGFSEGLFWSLCSTLTGSYLAFRIARWGGRAWLAGRFGQYPHFRRIADARPGVASVALIRMLPVSNLIINLALAVGSTGSRAFLLGSLAGFLPQGIVAVLIGSGLAEDVPWAGAAQIGLAGLLVLAVAALTYRQRRHQG